MQMAFFFGSYAATVQRNATTDVQILQTVGIRVLSPYNLHVSHAIGAVSRQFFALNRDSARFLRIIIAFLHLLGALLANLATLLANFESLLAKLGTLLANSARLLAKLATLLPNLFFASKWKRIS
ncbi:hypothetical protein [Peribacillus muralis]|uniref:hypothetical protein n=1 Tax=Peribacillus muralis TaxID=264697 RepID=UPI003D04CC56